MPSALNDEEADLNSETKGIEERVKELSDENTGQTSSPVTVTPAWASLG